MASSTPLPRSRLALAGAIAAGPGLLVLVLSSLIISGAGFIEVVADGVTAYIPVDALPGRPRDVRSARKGPAPPGRRGRHRARGRAPRDPGGPADARIRLGRRGRPDRARRAAPAEVVVLPIFGAGFFGTELADRRPRGPCAARARLVRVRAAAREPARPDARGSRGGVRRQQQGRSIIQGATSGEPAPAGLSRRSLLGRTIVIDRWCVGPRRVRVAHRAGAQQRQACPRAGGRPDAGRSVRADARADAGRGLLPGQQEPDADERSTARRGS